MKICQVVPIYLPGILPGCARYIQDISEILARRDHQVTVLTADAIAGRGWVDPLFGRYSKTREEVIRGVRVKRLKTRWPVTSAMVLLREAAMGLLPRSTANVVSLLSAGPCLSGLRRELENRRDEVIHVTAFPFGLVPQVGKACKVLNQPFLCTPLIHFEDPRHRNPLLWKALKDAEAVIACSHYEKKQMLSLGIDSSRIHVIPMGIHGEDWKAADGERFRRKHGLGDRKIVLFAGTKDFNKGAIYLLQAMDQARHQAKDLTLVSIGLPTRQWARQRGLLPSPHLLDLGYVSEEEKRDAFDACDLFVMPSRHDSFGIVYLEAWQCGKPVIGARVGAIPEIIDHGKDGLLVEFGDVAGLAAAIGSLLGQPDLSRSLGETGRKKVSERFHWEKQVEQIEDVFKGARTGWRSVGLRS